MIQMECFLHILLAKIQIANEIYLRRTKKNAKIIHFCLFLPKTQNAAPLPHPLSKNRMHPTIEQNRGHSYRDGSIPSPRHTAQ